MPAPQCVHPKGPDGGAGLMTSDRRSRPGEAGESSPRRGDLADKAAGKQATRTRKKIVRRGQASEAVLFLIWRLGVGGQTI